MKTNASDSEHFWLSIVIPTMNRQVLLAETLGTIASQLIPEVELVILDSSDDSDPVKKMVQKAGGRYVWQKARGFDQAYLDVVGLARGEYIWLFGDDDLMKTGAVETALRILRSSNSLSDRASSSSGLNAKVPLDLLIVNADVIAAESSRILKPQVLTIPETEYGLSGRSEVVARLGPLMSFMGSVIVRKDFWAQGVVAAAQHVGKRLITMIAPLMLPARRVRYVPSVLVSARYGHQSWMDTASVLIGQTMTEVIWSLPDVDEYAKQICTPRPPSFHSLLLWRALGQPVGLLPYTKARLIGWIPIPFMRGLCRTAIRLLGKTNSMTGYALGFY